MAMVSAMDLPDPMDKAWYLLTVILRLGHPVPAADLAIGCTSDFVEFICRIPCSPLLLTHDRQVLPSSSAFLAFLRLVSQSPLVADLNGSRKYWEGRAFWCRKRKQTELLAPNVKRRRSLLLRNYGNESSKADGDDSSANGIQAKHAADEITQFNASHSGFFPIDASLHHGLMISNRCATMNSLLLSTELLRNGICSNVKHGGREHDVGIISDNVGSVVAHRHLLSLSESEKEYSLGSGTKSSALLPEGKGAETILVSKSDIASAFPVSTSHPLLRDEFREATCSVISGKIMNLNGIVQEADIPNNDTETILVSKSDIASAFPVSTSHPLLRDEFREATCSVISGKMMNLNGIVQEADIPNNDAGLAIGHCQDRIKKETFDDVMNTTQIHRPYKQAPFESGHTEIHPKFVSTMPDQPANGIEDTIDPSLFKHSTAQKLLVNTKIGKISASTIGLEAVPRDSKDKENVNRDKHQNRGKGHLKCSRMKIRNRKVLSNEKNSIETKNLPQFDAFVVEEEEGSGGYGTVYRARRKTDGKTFAIKCPHPKANSYHVNNELKMLEQFGGRSFVIKFEGSFWSGSSNCFILEHVKHDRPETLKKSIDITELQWYGYCMFKALVSLHRQQIVHRDVKPGNFLFLRELNKGYLIDFNLAVDLHHKHRPISRSDIKPKGGLLQTISHNKSCSPTHSRKSLNHKRIDVDMNVNKSSNKSLSSNNPRKKGRNGAHGVTDTDTRKFGSQAADGSGLTSAKDATSTRTSVEKSRVPILWNVRKEIKSLVQEVMQNSNQQILAPTSQRKRIAAPVGKVEKMVASLTPMPLHANGIPISTSARLKDRGDEKHKSEGPCVGTKGFRAPEVLLKSIHQGCKVDVWSAGVTLLYLMIGRAPFGGDPEQNMKEIAKLRGSEDIWEVAKLHNRESSFPTDLFDIQSMKAMELKNWCQRNTKRSEFLEMIPDTLFDLIDKCLTVNPRLRISSEEALMHDFFFPCRERLRKQRLLRQANSSQAGSQVRKFSSEADA